MSTGFLTDYRFMEHDPGRGHPECAERISSCLDHLKSLPWFKQLKAIHPREASIDQIELVHSLDFIRHAEETCRMGLPILDSPDVGICRKSYDIALLAVGGTLELADQLMSGNISNGFALLRPPGHHAEKNSALGFCIFNNIAILTRYLKKKHGLEKILILDWDVHHGNGTQHIFEGDPSVLYISLHQYPFYPGTGAYYETGIGKGKGATLNIPMPAGSQDKNYIEAFQTRIIPKIQQFKPDIILISSGFDAHKEDPLANINLSTEMYGWMSERGMELADQFSEGKIISLLEGGYNLEVLPRCVEAHLSELMKQK